QSLKMRGVAFCFGATLLFTAAAPAPAATMTFDLKDATRDTGWRIEYDTSQVSAVSFTGKATGTNEGTLQIDKTFTSLSSIIIKFQEIAPAAANSFGFRITLNENVHNQSGIAWADFHSVLMDSNPVVPSPPASLS